jgi:hypothetical protein
MAYNQAIPQAPDLLSQSQSEIQENFAQIQTLVGINHINFGATGAGKHLYLQIPEHAAPATAVNEAGFYANVGATSTVTELFFRRENNGASIPMTESLSAATGWTFLPSGIMLQWGTSGINNQVVVNFPRAFPTACFRVFLTEVVTNGSTETNFVQVVDNIPFTTTQFTARAKTRSGGVATTARCVFLAIGA